VTTGEVVFFNNQRGFGFIKLDSGAPDVFVHISAVEAAGLRSLEENDKLSFEVQSGRAGKMQAVNLKLAE
jgi:CspA family cold shock protein